MNFDEELQMNSETNISSALQFPTPSLIQKILCRSFQQIDLNNKNSLQTFESINSSSEFLENLQYKIERLNNMRQSQKFKEHFSRTSRSYSKRKSPEELPKNKQKNSLSIVEEQLLTYHKIISGKIQSKEVDSRKFHQALRFQSDQNINFSNDLKSPTTTSQQRQQQVNGVSTQGKSSILKFHQSSKLIETNFQKNKDERKVRFKIPSLKGYKGSNKFTFLQNSNN